MFDDYPRCQRAVSYVDDVLAGRRLAPKRVRQACQRFLDDLLRDDWDFYFDPKQAERAMRFAEMLPHVKGKWARVDPRTRKPQTLKLEPWQAFILANIFGWLRRSTGKRRFLRASIYLPRKNGKSFLAAAIGWWMFAKDGEPGAEVYSGATSERQAWEVFRPALQMAKMLPIMAEQLGVELYKQSMVRSDGSKFQPVIAKPGDGASPHCAIVDEYHEHNDSTLYETMRQGMGAREQPLLLVISTAGDLVSGPCKADWDELGKVLDGSVQDEHFFGVIYERDEGDDWASELALERANPNWKVAIEPPIILAQMEEAKRDPQKQNAYRTKMLNEWIGASAGWLNMDRWHSSVAPDLKLEQCKGLPAFIALDAANKIDIFSVAIMFRDGDKRRLFCRHFLPEETASLEHNKHYRAWADAGHITLTPGARTSQHAVLDLLKEWCAAYAPRSIGYDPRELTFLMAEVANWCGCPVVEIPQSPTAISEPMKEFEALLNNGQLQVAQDPVLTWMASNVVRKEGMGGGTVKHYYPAKVADRQKIDGVVASIMALKMDLAEPSDGVALPFFA
jgi:phage terminase large subunit-like protein